MHPRCLGFFLPVLLAASLTGSPLRADYFSTK